MLVPLSSIFEAITVKSPPGGDSRELNVLLVMPEFSTVSLSPLTCISPPLPPGSVGDIGGRPLASATEF